MICQLIFRNQETVMISQDDNLSPLQSIEAATAMEIIIQMPRIRQCLSPSVDLTLFPLISEHPIQKEIVAWKKKKTMINPPY